MGKGGSSWTSGTTINNTLTQDFSELLGSNKAQFNLGYGSSSSLSNSVVNEYKNETLADLTGGAGGQGSDISAVLDTAKSVGFGFGGSGSGGPVNKEGGSSMSQAEGLGSSASLGASGISPLMLAGLAIAGLLGFLLIRRL